MMSGNVLARGTVVSRNRLPEETADRIVELYTNGMDMKPIAALLGISYTGTRNALVRRGIERRPKPSFPRIRNVNHSFFNDIDTEEKAYWLGFLMADGCVRYDFQVILLLATRDIDHIRKFASAIGTDAPIRTRTSFSMGAWRQNSTITICSKAMVSDLDRYNIVPRKSHGGKPCSLSNQDLQRHYWRGMFDGDGSISKASYPKRNWLGYQASFVGTEAIVSGFAEFIRERSSHPCTVFPEGNQFTFKFSGVGALQQSLSILYEDATVYLDRKYQLYQALMQLPVRAKRRAA